MLRMRFRLALTAVAVGLALLGCSTGVSTTPNGTSVASLLSSMKTAFANVKSVRMSGTVLIHGKSATLDLSMFRSGNLSGTVKVGLIDGYLLVVGGSTYVYVSKAFFRYIQDTQHVPSSACALMCGKYVKVPLGSLGQFNLADLSRIVVKHIPNADSVPQLRVTTFDGQAAYEVTDNSGARGYIAENAPHYLLGLSVPGQGTLTFSEWNAVPPISAPPASKIFAG